MKFSLACFLCLLLFAGTGCDNKTPPAQPAPAQPATPATPAVPALPAGVTMEKDPVCGMEVPSDAKLSAEYDGKTYHFCSESCQKEFKANPTKHLK